MDRKKYHSYNDSDFPVIDMRDIIIPHIMQHDTKRFWVPVPFGTELGRSEDGIEHIVSSSCAVRYFDDYSDGDIQAYAEEEDLGWIEQNHKYLNTFLVGAPLYEKKRPHLRLVK